MGDYELVIQLKRGCDNAFREIYNRYWDRLYRFVYRMTQNDDLSQTIVQDLFVNLWEKRRTADIMNIESYLFQSAKFQVFKNYRDNKFNKEVLETRFEEFVDENINEINEELAHKLSLAINNLPEKRRRILLMNKVDGLSCAEISKELDISYQTVRNQLSTAIKQVRLDLKNVNRAVMLLCIAKYLM